MAKLTLTVDTEDHSLAAEINGTPVSLNVESINVYNFGSGDRPRYTFCVSTRNQVDDVQVRTLVEAELAPAEAVPSEASADLREYWTPAPSDAAEAVAAWFGEGRS